MIRRLARRVHALAVTVNRATALADSREEAVALAARVDHLERVVRAQGESERSARLMSWRYWARSAEQHESALEWRRRAVAAERALAELEPVVTGGDGDA